MKLLDFQKSKKNLTKGPTFIDQETDLTQRLRVFRYFLVLKEKKIETDSVETSSTNEPMRVSLLYHK
jgi:hypothetical protein